MLTRFSRLLAEYSSFQTKVKQRLTVLEKTPKPDEGGGDAASKEGENKET